MSTEKQTLNHPGAHHKSHRFHWIIILLLLILMLGSGYWYYLLKMQLDHVEEITFDFGSIVQTQKETLIREIDTKLNTILTPIEQRLAEAEARLEKIAANNGNFWRVLEAQHYVNTANLKVHEHDTKTAIYLLKEADKHLKDLNDARMHSAREAISTDLVALESFKLPDLKGLWNTVEAMVDNSKNLKMKGAYFASEYTAKKQEETAEPGTLENTWTEIKSLVKIRNHQAPVEPLLTEREQYLLKQQLAFHFEQIRTTLLGFDQNLFNQSVLNTTTFLNNYFEKDNSPFQFVENGLTELAKVLINPDVPKLINSQTAMEQMLIKIQKRSVS